jgi:hypothetical protein
MPHLPEPPASGALKDDLPIYLYVAVTDAGPGLTQSELELLFQCFSHPSRKFWLPNLREVLTCAAKTHSIVG